MEEYGPDEKLAISSPCRVQEFAFAPIIGLGILSPEYPPLANQRMTQEYQKAAVNGASPLQLIILLYDGALKFMQSGRKAMEEGNRDLQNASLQKAQKVLMELMSCLDMKQGGEISKNLLSLYSYVLNELVMANMTDDRDGVDRGIKVLTDLRESWREIQNSLRPVAQESRLAA